MPNNDNKQKLADTFYYVMEFMFKNSIFGGCHSLSALAYVLLMEQGIISNLFVGEVRINEIYDNDLMKKLNIPKTFSHSWIEIDSKKYDIAISMPLVSTLCHPPVINSKNIITKRNANLEYGICGELDESAHKMLCTNVYKYMRGFNTYKEKVEIDDRELVLKDGLWNVVYEIGNKLSMDLSNVEFEEKYSNIQWEYVKAK